ncbi:MAG: hypothetical protein WBA67_04560, partial [Jannaschia sp.]
VVRRGGTIFRAFNLDGGDLVIPDRTVCLAVEEVARDGRALPIPVVTSIDVHPDAAALDLINLRLAVSDDGITTAEASARPHRETLTQVGTTEVQGENFLCAGRPGTDALSCQILPPYPSPAPLVIYCDAQRCEMPVLLRDDHLTVSAAWRRDATGPEAVGVEISARVRSIADFLEDQI